MLVENQKIEIKWTHQNKDKYEDKGYKFTKYGDSFYVNAEDLSIYSKEYVKVVCDYCGKEYNMAYNRYAKILNSGKKVACSACRSIKKAETTLLNRQDKLYNSALKVCNEKGYDLITNKEEIKRNTTYVKYICPIHGLHEMRINNLINGRNCPECSIENNKNRCKLDCDEVYKRIEECGGILINKEDYTNQYDKNLLIKCPKCGEPFLTSLTNFTQHGGQVCDNCLSSESIGEIRIKKYLMSHGILFKQEYWFDDCRDVNPLPFDFYLPEYNTVCEFDGRQHFGETGYFSYTFEEIKKHDDIKNKYCKDNNITLIRIPYWNINKIDEILDKELYMNDNLKQCA